jgi:AcrR family transcriptional regulator
MIDAARSLFAERGVEAVSMREVGRAARQRNTNAVQYHFGDRDTLLREVLAPHHEQVGILRARLLDELTAEVSARDLAGALVRPSAAMLETAEGRDYLRIVADLITDPATLGRGGPLDAAELGRWHRTARRNMPSPTLPLHRRFSAINLCVGELGRRAASRRRSDHRLFVSDLVDLVAGVLGADVSSETLALLVERDRDTSD